MARHRLLHLLLALCVFATIFASVRADGDEEEEHGDDKGETDGEAPATPSFLEGLTGKVGFMHAFVASLSVIIVSEIGDKTFFIAAIMAMTHPRKVIFLGAIGALAVMTVLSAALGFATTIIPRVYTYYASTLLFAVFGIKMLRDGLQMSPDEGQEELEEVTLELRQKEEELGDIEQGGRGGSSQRNALLAFVSPVMLQAFTLTFLAEWGDRSQITTIILAAREDPWGVTIGGILGHALCTGLAVLGGRLLAQRISVRTVTLVGAVVFLLFALVGILGDPNA